MKLDIIVPAYNEEENIFNFYDAVNEALKGIKHNFIFVDDGSKDKTLQKLKELHKKDDECVKIVSFSKNFGKEAAMYAGFLHSKAEFTCIIDCDLQQDPSYLVKMYKFLRENDQYDAVCMCQKQKEKRGLQRMFYKLMGKLSNMEIVDGASDFRMFRRNVVDAILEMSERNRFSKGIFSYVGFRTYYDSYKVKERKAGVSKWNKLKLLNYAFDGIVSFSTKPLRFATYTGILTSFIAFIYLVVVLIKTFTTGIETPGYASLMCVMLFLGGIQLIFLGIIGEYLGKTYNETKRRPIFIARERIGFDEDFL